MQFFVDNALLISVAFISGAMLVWPYFRSRAAGPSLSTLQVTQMINHKSAQVIDVRDATEFASGTVPGAKNFPVAVAVERAAELKKDKPVIVIDAGGAQAGRIAAQLRASGFAEVFVLAGGLAAWRTAGLPLRS